MNVSREIEALQTRINHDRERVKWLRENRKVLESLPEGGLCGDRIDFDNLPHAKVIEVVRKLGGKWRKNPSFSNPQRIDYERSTGAVHVRCYQGEPPPSCRLVEVEEDVPEQVIPAHKKKVLKMICTGAEPVAVALSRANSPLPNATEAAAS